MLEINRKIEFLAETGSATRDFKKAFGSATVVAWLFCSHDNSQHKSLCEKFFKRLNVAQKEGHANYRKNKAMNKLQKHFNKNPHQN
jgi:hypothetical protein